MRPHALDPVHRRVQVILVVCHRRVVEATRKLWPDAATVEPNGGTMGYRADHIIIMTGPSHERDMPWYDILTTRLRPAGDIVWLA